MHSTLVTPNKEENTFQEQQQLIDSLSPLLLTNIDLMKPFLQTLVIQGNEKLVIYVLNKIYDIERDVFEKGEPRSVTNALLNSLLFNAGLHNQHKLSLALLRLMPRLQLQADVITYTAVIRAFAKKGDLTTCQTLFQEMKRDDVNVFPNVHTYSALMLCYTVLNRPREAITILQEMGGGNAMKVK